MLRRVPSLKPLRAFEAVARLGSVSAAANELAVTPGAVSHQIKTLEEEIGVLLLTRTGRGIRLTSAGTHCQSYLRPAFARIAEAIEGTRQLSATGRVLVYVPTVFAMVWLVPRLDYLARQVPGTNIVVRTGFWNIPSDADMVINWGRWRHDPEIAAERLTNEEIFPVCSPRVARSIARTDDLAKTTLLHQEHSPAVWEWPDAATACATGPRPIGPCAAPSTPRSPVPAPATAGAETTTPPPGPRPSAEPPRIVHRPTIRTA